MRDMWPPWFCTHNFTDADPRSPQGTLAFSLTQGHECALGLGRHQSSSELCWLQCRSAGLPAPTQFRAAPWVRPLLNLAQQFPNSLWWKGEGSDAIPRIAPLLGKKGDFYTAASTSLQPHEAQLFKWLKIKIGNQKLFFDWETRSCFWLQF